MRNYMDGSPIPDIKPMSELVCVRADGYEHDLTEGRVYVCLYGLEDGLFYDRPYVTVVSDKDFEISAHSSRFILREEANNA